MNRAIPTGQGSKINEKVRRRLPTKKESEAPKSEDTPKTKRRGCWGRSSNKLDPEQQTAETPKMQDIRDRAEPVDTPPEIRGRANTEAAQRMSFDDVTKAAGGTGREIARDILNEIRQGKGVLVGYGTRGDRVYVCYTRNVTVRGKVKKFVIKREVLREFKVNESLHASISTSELVYGLDEECDPDRSLALSKGNELDDYILEQQEIGCLPRKYIGYKLSMTEFDEIKEEEEPSSKTVTTMTLIMILMNKLKFIAVTILPIMIEGEWQRSKLQMKRYPNYLPPPIKLRRLLCQWSFYFQVSLHTVVYLGGGRNEALVLLLILLRSH